jgi:hypothetical protein
MIVTYITNDGSGNNGPVDISPGTNLGNFLGERLSGGADPGRYSIMVNRRAANPSTVLQPNDIVSVTPNKMGAG